jgi:hypothetical protein
MSAPPSTRSGHLSRWAKNNKITKKYIKKHNYSFN